MQPETDDYTFFDMHTKSMTRDVVNVAVYIDVIPIFTIYINEDADNTKSYCIYNFKDMCKILYDCNAILIRRAYPVYKWVSQMTCILKTSTDNTIYLSNTQFILSLNGTN